MPFNWPTNGICCPSRRSTQHNAQQSAQHVTQLAAQNNMLYISYAQHNIPPVIKCCGKCYTTGRQTRRTSHHAAQHNILPIKICCGTYYPSCRPKTTYCSRENAQHDMLHNIMLITICWAMCYPARCPTCGLIQLTAQQTAEYYPTQHATHHSTPHNILPIAICWAACFLTGRQAQMLSIIWLNTTHCPTGRQTQSAEKHTTQPVAQHSMPLMIPLNTTYCQLVAKHNMLSNVLPNWSPKTACYPSFC